MKQHMYSITEDGFGIHTFELNIPNITNESFAQIMSGIEDNNINHYHKDDGSVIIYPSRQGIKIHLNRADNGIYGIRVVVSAAKLIDNNASPIAILNTESDFDCLYHYLNDTFEESLGEEYDIDSFYLSRVDCCVNIMLSESYSAERYIKLIRRSMNYGKRDKIHTFPSSELDSYEKNGHSFRVDTADYTFTAYDKYFQLEDIDEDYDAISDSMLRLEITVRRYHICALQRENDLNENIKILEAFAVISRSIFEKYIHRYFSRGNYYCYNAMCDMIMDSSLSNKKKDSMLLFAHQQVYCDSYRNARKNFIENLSSKNQYYKAIKGFKLLNINPMSLSYRDKHGDECIPGLYYLLDM